MARGFTIKETDIFNVLIQEFNDTAFSSAIEFSLGDWIGLGQDENGNPKGLLINKYSFNNKGKFDVHETYDENTYAKSSNSFVAMSVGSLPGEFIALETIKDVVYDTTVEFLVCADNIVAQKAITLAIEEVRKRFIQYLRTFEVSYMDLEDTSTATRIKETLKLVFTSGTIDYGTISQINGNQYLSYSMPVTLRATNFGIFANQQKIYLGVDNILDDEDAVKMFLLEPNEWHYGTASGIESAQLLPSKSESTLLNAKEGKSIQKNKVWSFSMDVQIDLQNEDVGPILEHLYDRSLNEILRQDIYSLKIETYLFYADSNSWVASSETYWNAQDEDERGSVANVDGYPDVPSGTDADDYDEGYALAVSDGGLPETYTYYQVETTDAYFGIKDSLTMNRKMICTLNQPNESLSKGDKITNHVILTPYKVPKE